MQNAKPNADKQCHVCGKKGHISSECWQRADKRPPQTSGKGVGKVPKGGKGLGKGKDSKDTAHQNCLKCGQAGHYASECRKVLNSVAEGASTEASDAAEVVSATQALGSLEVLVTGLFLNSVFCICFVRFL